MNDYTFKDSKYFDVIIKSKTTGKTDTFRMCQNLKIDFNNLLGTYVFNFLYGNRWHCVDTNNYVITID